MDVGYERSCSVAIGVGNARHNSQPVGTHAEWYRTKGSHAMVENNHGVVDVLSIGHAVVDVLAHVDDAFLLENDLTKGTFQLVDASCSQDLFDRMPPTYACSGGSAANTAAGVVSCGATSRFIGRVADDDFGTLFAHDMRAAGVHFETEVGDGKPTARCLAMVTPDGQRTMRTHIGIASDLDIEHVDTAALLCARTVYVEGFMLSDEHLRPYWKSIFEKVRKAGNNIAFSLSDSFCVDFHRSLMHELLETSVDIVFGNEAELLSLFETDDAESALAHLRQRCEIVVITRSERGATLARGNERIDVDAIPTTVVDTTGAGDQFAAGVLAGLAQGDDLLHAGRLGAQAAGEVIAKLGARNDGDVRVSTSS